MFTPLNGMIWGGLRAVWAALLHSLGHSAVLLAIGGFFDWIGVLPGFIQTLADPDVAYPSGILVFIGTILFELLQLVTKPDMSLPSCEDDSPELPLEEK